MSQFVFCVIAGVIAAASILVVIHRNIFHCALYLALAMFGVSAIFLYLNAEFLAAVQVLIYVGAVTVLIIFGIMLTRSVMDEKTPAMNKQVFLSLLVAVGVTFLLFKVIDQSSFAVNEHPNVFATAASTGTMTPPESTPQGSYQGDVLSLGQVLLKPNKGFAFAFEFVSVLLLSALVGALVIARRNPS